METLTQAATGHIVLTARGFGKKIVPIFDAEVASRLWCEYRDMNGFGASSLKSDSGSLVDANGKRIGHVSYNGNVFIGTVMVFGQTYLERAGK